MGKPRFRYLRATLTTSRRFASVSRPRARSPSSTPSSRSSRCAVVDSVVAMFEHRAWRLRRVRSPARARSLLRRSAAWRRDVAEIDGGVGRRRFVAAGARRGASRRRRDFGRGGAGLVARLGAARHSTGLALRCRCSVTPPRRRCPRPRAACVARQRRCPTCYSLFGVSNRATAPTRSTVHLERQCAPRPADRRATERSRRALSSRRRRVA